MPPPEIQRDIAGHVSLAPPPKSFQTLPERMAIPMSPFTLPRRPPPYR
ncbi:MAG: hypothetical protein V8T86_01905 [Victivallis sp.]